MCSVDAVISSDLRDDLLVGCEDLRKLKIIPANFPHQTVRAVSSIESMKQKLLEKFPDTLSDSLSPVPMRTPDGHMHISMDQHATPHQEVVTRRIPLRYKPQSVVQDLISKNVITKVDIPTRWVSPAFFVPKPDGICMRLVTDYTKLNKYVHRPIHPFPSTRDIIQSIPHGQKLFAKLDAVHGYCQLALDEELSYLRVASDTYAHPSVLTHHPTNGAGTQTSPLKAWTGA